MHFTAFVDINTGTVIEFITSVTFTNVTAIGVNTFAITTWFIFTFINVDAVSLVIRKSETFVTVTLE
ncbi:MAG: hypothetical protein CMJ52_07755 [Planctomycetaceae bacterium]|nr:hypothetical protein [Planctomycetaceae bacterium]